jgi:hypothetical protein
VAYTIVAHISNTDPVVGEVDELPAQNATMIILKNPRKVDGKDLHFLSEKSTMVYWPIEKVNFLEVMGSETEEEIIGFVRE